MLEALVTLARTTVHTKTHLNITRTATGLVLGVAMFFGWATGTQALTISPPQIEFGVYPGQQADIEVKLYNEDATQAMSVTTETTTFGASAEPGVPQFAESATATDIASWIKLEPGPFTLEPLGRKVMQVSVDVPENAEPGGHYGAILFTFKRANAPADSGQISIDSKVATLLLVRIEGSDIVEAATIKAFGASSGTTWYSHLPIGFTTDYTNTGSIHLKPKGSITITNTFGREVANLEFNSEKGSTLPKETRRYDKEIWAMDTVQPLVGNAWSNFWTAYGNERANFAIGKFTATLNLTAGTGGKVATTASTSFYVLPWHVLTVYGIGFLILLVLIIFGIKRYNSWILKRAKTTNLPPPGSKK